MKILVGCPVSHRNWILPTWFEYVEEAFKLNGLQTEYVFALDAGDEETLACIDAHVELHNSSYSVSFLANNTNPNPGFRNWHQPARLKQMTRLRNQLLSSVRKVSPDYFLSLDSDILINPLSLRGCLDELESERFDAISSKVFLSKGGGIVNAANYTRMKGIMRVDVPYVTKVDVIMAYKLMNKRAYSIDYTFNTLGEDIGWSMECKKEGVSLGYSGEIASKHVMAEDELFKIDKRCGY